MSKTQVDRLGERLRANVIDDDDLRRLDEYRREFAPAYEYVVALLRDRLAIQATGRPAKSTTSIVDKLRRESIRLTQMQDIAGVRLIVSNIQMQDTIVRRIGDVFDEHTVVDRRERPSHGYRAVHIIATIEGMSVEIQVRTELQHIWAELSEKFSDLIDPSVKYGGGDEQVQSVLARASASIARLERNERKLIEIERSAAESAETSAELISKLQATRRQLEDTRTHAQTEYGARLAELRALAELKK